MGPLSTPWGSWLPGESFNPGPTVPKDKIIAWRQQGIVIMDDDGPDVEEIIENSDILSDLTRQQLLSVIRDNNLNQLPNNMAVKPRTSWTEETIRQAIRDCGVPMSQLTLPAPVVSTVENLVPQS